MLVCKFCSFDCVYCECGFNKDRRPKQKLPTREEVKDALRAKLEEMKINGPAPDVLTFAGNGEPTAHPHFAQIIDDTLDLRDEFFPNAKVSVLTNGTMLDRPQVFEALYKVDNNIVKLDTINQDYIETVDRPTGKYDVRSVIELMKLFKGHCIVQTMFMNGTFEGKDVSNTSNAFVEPWLEAVKYIAPSQVMIYTIDRDTPGQELVKATHEELDGILERLKAAGISATASY